MVTPVHPVRLGEDRLTIETVVRVSRQNAPVELMPVARERVQAARAVVERLAVGGAPIYGLNTGLGAAVDTILPLEEIIAYQTRAVFARSVGIGPTLPRDQVRAIMFVRAAGLAAGGAGVSPAVLDALIALLNESVHPAIPSIGSIGAADLAPLAHMSLPLLGFGAAEYRGELLPGAEALRRAGLSPVTLGAKDGIALINANAASVGPGALALAEATCVLNALEIAGALSCEGFRANLSPLDPRAMRARSAPGQAEAATRLTALLAGSALWQPGEARRVQDPLSYRCLAPVSGAAFVALEFAERALLAELDGAGDNPLVLASDGMMISTANFDVTAVALAFEMLGQALAQAGGVAAERSLKLMSPELSDLPRFLTPRGQTRTGFATVQKTIAALDAEIRERAHPVSLAVRAVADRIEDHAVMAPRVVAKTAEITQRLAWLAAIELMVAAQAVDLRSAPLGSPLRAAHRAIRARVPMLDEDRMIGPDIEQLAVLVRSGELVGAVAAASKS
jgi:histidine ammonia-lyase